jgi:hypothetical protein
MADTKTRIERAYSAFNRRNVNGALALMTHDVSWPKASEGGKTQVRVRQLVKSLQGDVLSDSEVVHVFTMTGGLIAATDLPSEADAPAGQSAAFARRS